MSTSSDSRKAMPESIAVVGAGMAGLTCATSLMLNVPELKVFEKGLHAGGRMATHRDRGYEFDCGTQQFTVRGEEFRDALESWLMARVVAPWNGWLVELDRGNFMSRNDGERYVGVPTMGALAKHLAELCDVNLGQELRSISDTGSGLQLHNNLGEDLGTYDLVLCATTPDVAQGLLTPVAPELAGRIAQVAMTSCWSLMLGFEQPLPVPFDAAYVSNSIIAWVARNNSKPGRAEREAWVVHATPEWSEAHAAQRPADVINELLEAFDRALGGVRARPKVKTLRLWEQAAPIDGLGEAHLFDAERGIGVCGDWCVAPRLEGAFTSGLSLANRVMELL